MTRPSREERRSLRVGVAHDDPAVAGGLCAALRRRGHVVRIAASADELGTTDALDALVLDVDLSGGAGLEALEGLRATRRAVHVVLLSAQPSLEVCRQALRLGAADLVPVPYSIDEVVEAVERAPVRRSDEADGDDRRLARAYLSTPEGVLRAARDVVAFALRAGFGPAARARLGAAAHELLDNARAHGYPDAVGSLFVEAAAGPREVALTVTDRGAGFDPVDAQLAGVGAAQPGGGDATTGLARVAALVEDVRIESSSRGTSVEVRVVGSPCALADASATDLSDLDWLDPAHARAVLAATRGADEPELVGLSPALAVSVGRLLAGRTPAQAAQAALWS